MEQRLAPEAQNQIMLPKTQKYDKFMDAEGTIDLTRAAKSLNFPSAKALGAYLRPPWIGSLPPPSTSRPRRMSSRRATWSPSCGVTKANTQGHMVGSRPRAWSI